MKRDVAESNANIGSTQLVTGIGKQSNSQQRVTARSPNNIKTQPSASKRGQKSKAVQGGRATPKNNTRPPVDKRSNEAPLQSDDRQQFLMATNKLLIWI